MGMKCVDKAAFISPKSVLRYDAVCAALLVPIPQIYYATC